MSAIQLQTSDSSNRSLSQKILNLLEKSRYCPTGDNCQPWRFEINENQLFIFNDSKRGKHAFNLHHSATYLSLGTLIESLDISASEQDLQLKIELQNANPDHEALVKIQFIECQTNKNYLADFLYKRCTDRRPYFKEPLQEKIIKDLQALNSFENCTLAYSSSLSSEFRKFIVRSDEMVWLHEEIVIDLFRWIRLTNKDIETSDDGMPWNNLGLKWYDIPFLKLVAKYPSIPKKLWKLGFQAKVNTVCHDSLKNMGGTLAFFVKQTDRQSIIETGRLAMRVWLYITSIHQSMQPLSSASLIPYDITCGKKINFLLPDFHQHFLKAPSLFRNEYHIGRDWTPLWLFRVGQPKEKGDPPRTKRLPVEDLILNAHKN